MGCIPEEEHHRTAEEVAGWDRSTARTEPAQAGRHKAAGHMAEGKAVLGSFEEGHLDIPEAAGPGSPGAGVGWDRVAEAALDIPAAAEVENTAEAGIAAAAVPGSLEAAAREAHTALVGEGHRTVLVAAARTAADQVGTGPDYEVGLSVREVAVGIPGSSRPEQAGRLAARTEAVADSFLVSGFWGVGSGRAG